MALQELSSGAALCGDGLGDREPAADGDPSAAENRFRSLVETAPVGIFYTDRDGGCRFVNPCWCVISGLSLEQALGEGWISGLHGQDRERVTSEWYQAARAGQPFQAQYRFRSPGGRTTWVLGRASAIHGEDGDVAGYVGTISEINEQKLTEQALGERVREMTCLYEVSRIVEARDLTLDDRLRQIVDTLPPAFQFPEIARARVTLSDRKIASEGYEGTRWRLQSSIPVDGRLDGAVELVYLEERPERYEGPFLREERSLIDEVAVRLADVVERDLADRSAHELRQELNHVARVTTLGELTASLAHELRQPLTAIQANAEAVRNLLAARPPNIAAAREAIADLARDNHRAESVIERLRALLRPRASARCALRINDVVREVLRLLRYEAETNGIHLRAHLEPDLPPVRGDRVELQQVLMNLIVNGFEAMRGAKSLGRELSVRSRRAAAGGLVVSVADQGHGLDEAEAESLFEPFVTTKAGGLGMGLTICRALVADHGGQIWVTSNKKSGATFHFALPTSDES